MVEHTLRDFQEGRVICGRCHTPIYDPAKTLRHMTTGVDYHEEPCFMEALKEKLEAKGLDVSSMPQDLENIIRGIMGITKIKHNNREG